MFLVHLLRRCLGVHLFIASLPLGSKCRRQVLGRTFGGGDLINSAKIRRA